MKQRYFNNFIHLLMQDNNPVSEPIPMPTAPKSASSPKNLTAIGLVVVVVSLILVIVYLLLKDSNYFSNSYGQNNQNPNQTSPTPSQTSVQSTPEPTGIATNKVFYVKDNNIFSYDVETLVTDQWTTFGANPKKSPTYDSNGNQIPNISIVGLSLVDPNTLGFGQCSIIINNFGCSLSTINLATKAISLKKSLNNDEYLLALDFHTADTFAYLVDGKTKWRLAFVEANTTVSYLQDIPANVYGRGGFKEDSLKMRFSNDGKYLFEIATSSPIDSTDFSVYVYNLFDGTNQKIENATQPAWLDNKKIIFRRYQDGGFFIYDADTKASTQITGIGADGFEPHTLRNQSKVLYHLNNTAVVHEYDLSTNTDKLLISNAMNALYVNDSKLVFNEMKPCTPDECMEATGWQSSAIKIFDLTTNSVVGIIKGATISPIATMKE